ncbi:hypothetical protein SUGI_0099420 [Cryptomeria japonica]|nr:hypothetical protein SUGI_0099420 [Cryptomeria japonica]
MGKNRCCVCAPPTHEGSFKCALHRKTTRPLRSPPVVDNNTCNDMDQKIVSVRPLGGQIVAARRALFLCAGKCNAVTDPRNRSHYQKRPSRLCNMSVASSSSSAATT